MADTDGRARVPSQKTVSGAPTEAVRKIKAFGDAHWGSHHCFRDISDMAEELQVDLDADERDWKVIADELGVKPIREEIVKSVRELRRKHDALRNALVVADIPLSQGRDWYAWEIVCKALQQ